MCPRSRGVEQVPDPALAHLEHAGVGEEHGPGGAEVDVGGIEPGPVVGGEPVDDLQVGGEADDRVAVVEGALALAVAAGEQQRAVGCHRCARWCPEAALLLGGQREGRGGPEAAAGDRHRGDASVVVAAVAVPAAEGHVHGAVREGQCTALVLHRRVAAGHVDAHRRDELAGCEVEGPERVLPRLLHAHRVDPPCGDVDDGRARDADGVHVAAREVARRDRLAEVLLPLDGAVGAPQRVEGVVLGRDDHPVADHEGLRVQVAVEHRTGPALLHARGSGRTVGRHPGALLVVVVGGPVGRVRCRRPGRARRLGGRRGRGRRGRARRTRGARRGVVTSPRSTRPARAHRRPGTRECARHGSPPHRS